MVELHLDRTALHSFHRKIFLETFQALAALNVHRDHPLLQVYSPTQEKLGAIISELQGEKNRVSVQIRHSFLEFD